GPAVREYMENLLDAADTQAKFLFFAHHQTLLDDVQQEMEKRKVKFIRIDGKTPSTEREKLVRQFQEERETRVAVLSIKAAGTGLTLTAASTVIFGELSWTPGDIVQAEDRAHRIGQVNSVNIQYLHAKETIDDLIWGSVANKLDCLGQVLDGRSDGLNANCVQATSAGQSTLDAFMDRRRADAPGQRDTVVQHHPGRFDAVPSDDVYEDEDSSFEAPRSSKRARAN
ncbi:hypothetical protein CYMTET_14533, partial [Cymbomonas tetramitiformis]